jgi:methylated-DNA-protein-cysteine methyltransferase related protein
MKEKKEIRRSLHKLTTLIPSGEKDQNFFEQVYNVARQIPKGKVTSYGAIAKCLGSGKSARMVGWAMNSSRKIRPKVPAHRVVNSLGLLTGKLYFETPTKMEELLTKEGTLVKNNKVVDFKNKFWNPMQDFDV